LTQQVRVCDEWTLTPMNYSKSQRMNVENTVDKGCSSSFGVWRGANISSP